MKQLQNCNGFVKFLNFFFFSSDSRSEKPREERDRGEKRMDIDSVDKYEDVSIDHDESTKKKSKKSKKDKNVNKFIYLIFFSKIKIIIK